MTVVTLTRPNGAHVHVSTYWVLNTSHARYIQSNLDYSKCHGPQECFRIIGSSNDRKREFSDIFGKARTFHRPEFATSTPVFREVVKK